MLRRALDRGLHIPILLAAITAGFFWRILFQGRAIAGLDVVDYFAPYRTLAQQAIDSGRLPLWNPDIFGGVPFLANIQSAVFYPLTGLFYLIDEPTAYAWNIVLHAFMGALFMYLFARQALGAGRTGSVIGGVMFAFGGFLGGQTGHLNQFSAAIWLPALLLCWDLAASGRLLYVLLGALVVALQFLAGHTQESYLLLVCLGLYTVWTTLFEMRFSGARIVGLNLVALLIVVGLGAGLAAAQLVPTSELTSWSIRNSGLSYADATSFSLEPRMLLEALLPPFFGRTMVLQPGGTEFLGYVSIMGLALAITGVALGRRHRTWFFAALVFGAVALALGKNDPAYPLLFKIVPGFNLFRVPARWLFLSSFGLSALAAIGADALLAESRRKVDWRLLAGTFAAVAVAALAVSRRQDTPPGSTVEAWAGFGLLALVGLPLWALFAPRLSDRRALPPMAGGAASAAPALAPVGLSYKRPAVASSPWRAVAGAGMLGIVIAELAIASQVLDYNHPTLPSDFSQSLPTLDFLGAQGGPFRLVSVAQDTYVPAAEPAIRQALAGQLSPDDILGYLRDYKLREIAEPNTSATNGLATMDGYDGGLLPLARYVAFKNVLTGLPSSPDDRIRFVVKWLPNRTLLDLADVRYVLADSLSDKTAEGIPYDLSAFLHVAPSVPEQTITLSQPTQTGVVGVVLATSPAAAGTPVGTLTLSDAQGKSETVDLQAGAGQQLGPFAANPQLAVFETVVRLPGRMAAASAVLRLGSFGGNVYLNGLALVDDATGLVHTVLAAPGPEMRLAYKGDVKIYDNPAALPPAFLVHQGQVAANADEALQVISAPGFDPIANVVVESGPQPPPNTSLLGRVTNRLKRLLPASGDQPFTVPDSWLQNEASPDDPPDQVQLQAFQPEEVAVSTQSASAAFLVLSESYYPGWQVSVDGVPQRLMAADELFQAVHLGAGSHEVEFRFQPHSFVAGAAISVASCVVFVIGLALTWSGHRGRRPKSPPPVVSV
ncbi:MAG: YfhO family protein [Chloroflexi bacterium]|nr:YfhO family protein [Chloroflexota bacterium]